MTKKVIVDQLKEYFEQKGRVLTANEYREAEDAPIRIQVLKRKLGSWSRVINMVTKTTEVAVAVQLTPEPAAPVEEPAPVEQPAAVEEPAPVEKPKAPTKSKGA